ncbi:MAG: hypothetical protein LBV72_17315 [Tannerella sp.]|jgi:hypothetical protein|nr:hypothetical protein [Tannerella sp.]
MTRTIKALNIIYCMVVLLFLLDDLTNFDVKSQAVKTFVHYGVLIGTPLILLFNIFAIKGIKKKIAGSVLPVMILITVLIVGPGKVIFSAVSWRTQSVLYQNGHLSFKKIEFQMQDIGGMGYNKRKVEVLYLTPFFMITNKVPDNIDDKIEWIKIDKDINELGLKY